MATSIDELSAYFKERLSEQREETLKTRESLHELQNVIHSRVGHLELLIERQNTALEKQHTFFVSQMAETKEEVAKLNVKAVFFGAIAGFVISFLKELFVKSTGR